MLGFAVSGAWIKEERLVVEQSRRYGPGQSKSVGLEFACVLLFIDIEQRNHLDCSQRISTHLKQPVRLVEAEK